MPHRFELTYCSYNIGLPGNEFKLNIAPYILYIQGKHQTVEIHKKGLSGLLNT